MERLEQNKIQVVLLGRQIDDIKVAIITPIKSFYDRLTGLLSANEIQKDCFFKNAYFNTKNGVKGIIVYIPQGRGAQDVFFALKKVQVFFLGYAGGLKDTISIGDVLEISKVDDSTDVPVELNLVSNLECAYAGYSPCMLGSVAEKHRNVAMNKGCDVVEMEIAACARAAIETDNIMSAFVVVSDIPGSIEFWNLKATEQRRFEMGRKRLVHFLNHFLLKMQ